MHTLTNSQVSAVSGSGVPDPYRVGEEDLWYPQWLARNALTTTPAPTPPPVILVPPELWPICPLQPESPSAY